MLKAIDFDVLVLLASIMVVNHIVVHLKETKKVITYLQNAVKLNPTKGFWMIAVASFLVSPFLTNDGVCLLFVEPILNAFENNDEDPGPVLQLEESKESPAELLENDDVIYFLLALACSANIGSQLTYTGNPQNMIVSTDSIGVLPSYKFLLYMALPSVVAWFISKYFYYYCQIIYTNTALGWIYRCWRINKLLLKYSITETNENALLQSDDESSKIVNIEEEKSSQLNIEVIIDQNKGKNDSSLFLTICDCNENSILSNYSPIKSPGSVKSAKSPLSPRRKKKTDREIMIEKVVHVISSPFPYMVFVLLVAMIIMIFIDVLPISALICVTSMLMVVTVVVGNHWRNKKVWQTVSPSKDEVKPVELSPEEKTENLNVFFEDLFNSIDYSLLLIFLGTFIVVENMASTGIPKFIW